MKKYFSKILFLIFIMIFAAPLSVKANFGDLRYEVTDVNIKDSVITFKGWAFIHRTNNFTTVKTTDGTTIRSDGGQKVLMQAYNNGNLIDTVVVEGSSSPNYNFYCELFFKDAGNDIECTENNYKSSSMNTCENDGSGNGVGTSQCYYEDMAFKISFNTSTWNVDESSKITFKIAVSNNDFENKLGSYSGEWSYNNDYYTKREDVSVANASVSNFNNDYIIINKDSLATKVEFIAKKGLLLSIGDTNSSFKYNKACTWGTYKINDGFHGNCSSNIYELYIGDNNNYPNGRSKDPSIDRCVGADKKHFLGDCTGTNYFAIKVKKTGSTNGDVCYTECPADLNSDNYSVAVARGSHVKPVGTFSINIKNDKKCAVITDPGSGLLECNKSKTFNSTCDELTVHTDKGSAVVKIEQSGYVSSVLTPIRTYAGGGFNFGIMYYNTIKWNYVNGTPSSNVDALVKSAMNDKIKEYEEYTAEINITELNIGGKTFDSGFLVKKCSTSNTNKDYYDKELTVSCVFYIPDSVLEQNGDVEYKNGNGASIANKYYTPLKFDGDGKIEITASISGMNRITNNAARADSADDTKPWTDNWEDAFSKCIVEIYPLIYKDDGGGKFNFIYRPIDIYNPFPNRVAGVNWYDWYAISGNKDRLENTYADGNLQYSINLDNETITSIKQYNSNSTNGYFDWNTMDGEESTFIDEYFTGINRDRVEGVNS